MLEKVLGNDVLQLSDIWHLVNTLLNTILSSCFKTVDTCLMKRPLHNSHHQCYGHMCGYNQSPDILSHTVQFKLMCVTGM